MKGFKRWFGAVVMRLDELTIEHLAQIAQLSIEETKQLMGKEYEKTTKKTTYEN